MRLATGWLLLGSLATLRTEEPPTAYHAPADPRELLKIDEPMRLFFAERMQRHRGRVDRLRALLEAIHAPDGLNFTYDRECTLDPRETFRQRRGNCVSYTFLVVAVAREFGLEAVFQNVIRRPQWDRLGDFVVSVRHMNARVSVDREQYFIDLQPDFLSGITRSDMQVLTDACAIAEFYCTAGFFELLHGKPDNAMRDMVLATAADPRFAHAWINRAALHSHLGNLAEARVCFERAVRVDPKDLFALEGYVGLLQRLGSPEDLRIAAKYERRARTVRDTNPYYQQGLATLAQEQGDWAGAEKLLRRAIALKNDELQFHEQRVQALLQLGRNDDARRATARLEKLRLRLAAEQVHPN